MKLFILLGCLLAPESPEPAVWLLCKNALCSFQALFFPKDMMILNGENHELLVGYQL